MPHGRVDEPPAQGRVFQLLRPVKETLCLAHYIRRARHALDTTRDHELGITAADCSSCRSDRVETRAAQTVDRRSRHRFGQSGKQHSHAREIAIVLAGLVRTTEDRVVHRIPIDARIAIHQRLDRNGG